MHWQVFDSIRPFTGPLNIHEFTSCNFSEVFSGAVIPRQIHTDSAGKGPHCSTYLTAAEFPIAQQKSVCIPGITFLLSVKYIPLMQRNAALDLFPLQHSCFYAFSPQSSARLFCLYIASYRQFQQFHVGFGRRIVSFFENTSGWRIQPLNIASGQGLCQALHLEAHRHKKCPSIIAALNRTKWCCTICQVASAR